MKRVVCFIYKTLCKQCLPFDRHKLSFTVYHKSYLRVQTNECALTSKCR